jgi:hypothetical protein
MQNNNFYVQYIFIDLPEDSSSSSSMYVLHPVRVAVLRTKFRIKETDLGSVRPFVQLTLWYRLLEPQRVLQFGVASEFSYMVTKKSQKSLHTIEYPTLIRCSSLTSGNQRDPKMGRF